MMYGTSAADIWNRLMNLLDPWNVEFLGRFLNCMWLKAYPEPWG